ncbi:MAG: cation transporter [Acidobacteriales bacterium]|nr:cation transporter [Terriglobales bacterium]
MKKLVAIATVFCLLALPALAGEKAAEFDVKGMMCGSCQAKAEKALKSTDGVQSASVNWKEGTANVTYDDEKVTPEELKKVIKDAGFVAEEKKKS